MAANAGRLKQLQQQLVYSLALEDGFEDVDLDLPVNGPGAETGCAPAAEAAASFPGSATADADLLSEALRLASVQDMGSRLRSLQVAERQQLLRYLQLALSPGQQQPPVAAKQGDRLSSIASRRATSSALDGICATCEHAAVAAASWTCSGACRRVFHTACLAAPVTRRCSDCTSNRCGLTSCPCGRVARKCWLVIWGLNSTCA